MIKLVVTDIDDTLVCRERRVITKRGQAAMHALMDAGIVVGPATGRDIYRVGYSFRFDHALYSTAVVANGMKVYYEGEKVLERELPEEGLTKVAKLCMTDKRAGLLLFDDAGRIWIAGTTLDDAIEHDLRHLPTADGVSEELPEGRRAVKANCHFDGRTEDLLAFMHELAWACPELDFTCPVGGIIDITVHGWDKGEATLWLADQLGISHDEICAFGDAGNDEALIEKIPNSVAVANGFEDIIAKACWHIGTSFDDSVSAAFEDIAEAAKTGSMPAFMDPAVDERYRKLAESLTFAMPKGIDS